MAFIKPIKKRKKSEKLKKWFPIFLVLLMVVPSFIYFGTSEKKAKITLQFYIKGYSQKETLYLKENTSIVQVLSKYNPIIDNEKIYCLRNLCIDEGNWTIYVNGKIINPFEYNIKNGDEILISFQ